MSRLRLPLLMLALGVAAAAGAAPPARPNLLLIFTDDHAWQAVSAYGDERKLIETPHIDRLAREGMRLDRCLVPNAICGPSRATLLTGKYNHLNGFVNNVNRVFDGSQTTFPKLLHAAGYQTALVGKWHLESEPTGFDFWQILPGQGDYYNPVMLRPGTNVVVPGYVTDIITDLSLDWLKRRDTNRPFLLMCQHKAPHREWEPALRHLNHDRDRVYPEPPTLFDDYAGRGPAVKGQDMSLRKTLAPRDLKLVPPPRLTAEQRREWDAYYEPRNAAFRANPPRGDDLVRWRYQRYLHDYLGCVRGVDESVGRVLDYLDEAGLADNTVVVYLSDQGFFLGEHGWFDKRWIFEESMRTPLLVRWPGVTRPGSASRDIVSNLDLAETFLDAAGVPVPEDMQGRSLRPVLAGATPKDWRTSFYYQYFEYPDWHRVRPHYGVVTDRFKLVKYFGPGGDPYTELYDRQTDPREMRDVRGRPEYADEVRRLETELTRLRRQLKVPDHIPDDWFGKPPAAQRPPERPAP